MNPLLDEQALDVVFLALANATRRRILDIVAEINAGTSGRAS